MSSLPIKEIPLPTVQLQVALQVRENNNASRQDRNREKQALFIEDPGKHKNKQPKLNSGYQGQCLYVNLFMKLSKS